MKRGTGKIRISNRKISGSPGNALHVAGLINLDIRNLKRSPANQQEKERGCRDQQQPLYD